MKSEPVAGQGDRIKQMMASFSRPFEFNYTIHIGEAHRFVYFSNPIVACSTLKATLNLATARSLGLTFDITAANQIHDRQHNLLLQPRDIGYPRFARILADPTWLKFAFVRDPIARFSSAFIKKLRAENNFSRRVRNHLGAGNDIPIRDLLTIDRFAELVAADTSLRDLDEHWRLQRQQIFFDLVPEMQVYDLKDIAKVLPRLLTDLFGADHSAVFNATSLNAKNTSKLKGRDITPSLASIGLLKSAYAEDFSMLEAVSKREAKYLND